MRKDTTPPYEHHFKPYYLRHKKKGWRSYTVFGPEILLDAVKKFIVEFKKDNGLYERGPYKRS